MSYIKLFTLILESFIFIITLINVNESAKILIVLPHYGKSHHIFFSPFVEALASRGHEVVVINNFPLTNITNLKQILLPGAYDIRNVVDVEEFHANVPKVLNEFVFAYRTAKAFKRMAHENCRRLFKSEDVLNFMHAKEAFDVAVVEQFVTDCGLAVADRFKAPIIGVTAHVLLPWMYPRLGVDNNPAFVPNHFIGGENSPNAWNRFKSALINLFFGMYYRQVIQKNDLMIVKEKLSDVTDLEVLAKNISLVMMNQYFPLTGSRIYGANVVEIGGIHVKTVGIDDQILQKFLESATNGVVYISFGSIASDLSSRKINEIMKVVRDSDMRFVWKIGSLNNMSMPNNLLVRRWLPQTDILCHSNVFAFVSHSGMLSSSEALQCGVPVVGVPLFGDQFANAASARTAGLGVTIEFENLDELSLKDALNTVLQMGFRNRVKQLSQIWNDRPTSAMNTGIYWVEYIARHGAQPQLRPASVEVPSYQKLLIDVWVILSCFFLVSSYMIVKIVTTIITCTKYILNKLQK